VSNLLQITANSCRAGSNKLRKSGDPVLDLYGINPHNKGSEFDPSRKENKKMECQYCDRELKVQRRSGVGTDYWIITTCVIHGTFEEKGN